MSIRLQLILLGVIAAAMLPAASAQDGASPGAHQSRGGPDLDQMMPIERQDFGVQPTKQLHGGAMHGPTPASIPGGQVITTKGLVALVQGRQAPYLLFDVLGQQETLPNAVPAAWLSQPGSFDDAVQQQAGQMLGQRTQGRKDVALIFYCLSRECWMSYNAALRAINLGYRNVLWYRGGIEAWRQAGLPFAGAGQGDVRSLSSSSTSAVNAIAPKGGLESRDIAVAASQGASQRGPQSSGNASLAGTRFFRYEIVDKRMNGLVAATIDVPVGWKANSRVDWDYNSANNPSRIRSRVDAPDGSAWLETYPIEVFSWLSVRTNQAPGSRSFGMINYPNITVEEAMRRFVIQPYRGNKKNLQIVGMRPVPNLAQKFLHQNVPGEAVAMRIRYEENGTPVDEDFYAMLGAKEAIPYDGPQGRTWEYHRVLGLVHSLGARKGLLESESPLLGFMASSAQPNPVWQNVRKRVSEDITREFNRQLAQGYAQIAAAGRASAAISANNDAMIASMDSARAASNARYAAQRQASSAKANSDFDSYIRGTEKMNDPYWGTSEQAYTSSYHWTDGYGKYQHSNDAGFNPNVGGQGSWTLMTPANK